MNKSRSVALPAMAYGTLEGGIAGHRIGAVDFFEMKIRKHGHQPRNAATRGLHLDGHGDGIAIIFHAENYRQLTQGGGVHRLPELAFAGGAIAQRNVSYFVALKRNILELAVIDERAGWPILRVFCEGWERRNFGGIGMAREIAPTLGATHGLQNLRSRGRGLRNNVQLGIAPV